MSREILFKAKRKNWRELPKEEWWIEGNLITDEMDADVAYIGYVLGSENGVIHDIDVAQIAPETLCQYTGLTDKNGKRIWENDILHCRYHSEDDCIVVWYDGRFNFQTIHGQYNQDPMTFLSLCFTQRAVERLTVIGNIFDNPELLE